MWDLSAATAIEPMPSTVEAWSPNHWTAREFPAPGISGSKDEAEMDQAEIRGGVLWA